jgi:predicted DNA-binding transcriptional regulator AlpA
MTEAPGLSSSISLNRCVMNNVEAAKTRSSKAAVNELVDRTQAAQLLGVSPRTLDRWHHLRIGPPRVALGSHKVRYRLSSLDAWVRSREFIGSKGE